MTGMRSSEVSSPAMNRNLSVTSVYFWAPATVFDVQSPEFLIAPGSADWNATGDRREAMMLGGLLGQAQGRELRAC